MAGVKGKSGRHESDIKRDGYFFRLRPEVIERVERCTPLLEIQEGGRMSKAEALEHLLTRACEVVERTRADREAPAHMSISKISKISNGTPMAYDDMLGFLGDEEEEGPPAQPVDVPQTAETPSTAAEPVKAQTPSSKAPAWNKLPREKLQAIADERTLCEGLSLTAFAKRLHDKGIHSSTAKDGSKVPVNKGRLARWLDEAREAGLL